MHKYIPRVHIVRADDLMKINFCEFVTFSFEESEFIAVTAYQNEQVSAAALRRLNPLGFDLLCSFGALLHSRLRHTLCRLRWLEMVVRN